MFVHLNNDANKYIMDLNNSLINSNSYMMIFI